MRCPRGYAADTHLRHVFHPRFACCTRTHTRITSTQAQYPHDAKRRPQSRSFSRLLSLFSQQVFIGPPETTKELVFAAYQALQRGDWQKTNEHVMNLQMWSSMKDSQRVKDIVTDKIKTEGLRTYLYTYSQYYTTVQLGELAQKYELDEGAVCSDGTAGEDATPTHP